VSSWKRSKSLEFYERLLILRSRADFFIRTTYTQKITPIAGFLPRSQWKEAALDRAVNDSENLTGCSRVCEFIETTRSEKPPATVQ
jgi:hypothetical protein